MTAATARAYPNIALIKYWGKRDEELILPLAGSLSLTLDILPTTTTVELAPDTTGDRFELNGREGFGESLRRVSTFLDLVRSLAGSSAPAVVRSRNEAPTGAGLASSASGFAALATASAAAYGLDLGSAALSRLARRGSGSASRSIVPGVAVWHAGTDDESSFAEAVPAPEMHMVIVTVDAGEKPVSSREAMRRTAATSPFAAAWPGTTEESLAAMIEACAEGDFTRIGRLAETHALRMHALIQSCDPPIRYLAPQSIAVFDAIAALRQRGLEAYGTADAGPNVVVLTRPEDSAAVAEALTGLGAVLIAKPGPGAELVEQSAAESSPAGPTP